MATREELMQALRAAHEAGNTAAASAIAQRLQGTAPAGGAPGPAAGAQTPPDGRQDPLDPSYRGTRTPAERQAYEDQVRAGARSEFAGMRDAILKNALGVKQLFGGSSANDKAVLSEMQADADADPNKSKREAAGGGLTAGLTMVPAGAAARGVMTAAKVLPRALQWIAPAAAGAAVSGVQSGLLDVGSGDTFGEQMADKGRQAKRAAALGGALAAGGQLVNKGATQLVQPSAEAEKLMAEGITPTLQQGAEGWAGRFIGGLTSGAVNVSRRQNKEVLDAFMRRVAPGVDTADMTVPETVNMLRDQFPKQYQDLFAGRMQSVTPTIRRQIWDEARGASQPAAVENATGALGNSTGPAISGRGTAQLNPKQVQEYRNILSDAADQFKASGEVNSQTRTALLNARGKFDELVRNKGLSPEELSQLSDIDSRMGDFLRYQDAASKPGFHANPRAADVLRSYSNMADNADFATAASPTQRDLLEPATRVMGLTPTQDEARALISAVKRTGKVLGAGAVGGSAAVGNPVGLALAPLYGMSLAGQTGPGARAMFGQYPVQKALSEFLRGASPYLSGSGQLLGEQ